MYLSVVSKGNSKTKDYLHISDRPSGSLKQAMGKRTELLDKVLSESRAMNK